MTAVYVVFRNREVDLSWIPPEEKVVIVHNDRTLDRAACAHPRVEHVFSSENVGFGAGVNLVLEHVDTDRVVLCNPDTALTGEHWQALTDASPEEVVSLVLVERDGTPTSVVNRYPTPLTLLLGGWRVGRLFRRGGAPRRVMSSALGRWGRSHNTLLAATGGEWPLIEYWVSGAVISVDTARIKAVGGFDDAYFLYLEDVDLCHRLASRFPEMRLRLPSGAPAVHEVGGSVTDPAGRRARNLHHLTSTRRWSSAQHGWRWRIVEQLLAPRGWWLSRAR